MSDDSFELNPTTAPPDGLYAEFYRQWQDDAVPPDLSACLRDSDGAESEEVFRRLFMIDVAQRRQRNLPISSQAYEQRFPEYAAIIDEMLADLSHPSATSAEQIGTPATDETVLRTSAFDGDSDQVDSDEEAVPGWIGRYAVKRVLGSGGFGRVYLATDTELERQVALKVPHRHRLQTREDIDAFLEEARTVASLDHPGVVPIYDFGRIEDRCYVVSKYIDGEPLAIRLHRSPPTIPDVVRLLRSIAETLSFIHVQGVVHRDVKPGNLLLDRQGHCYLTDFGLALRDFSYGHESARMGTVNYMSPEQARGEGHLIDGRTDLFALGVIMYEMLTGSRPFAGSTWQEVVQLICHQEPRPLRERNPRVPKELERICLKLLVKRATDRYLTAQDLIDDLSHFLDETPSPEHAKLPSSDWAAGKPLDSRHKLVGIIPRGLRSFDEEDAAFFRELLPGPRNREGIPDSLRFWKRRIESADPLEWFRVGVIYGPSGSGKSSFVKAGLLPVLESRMTLVFVEAAAGDTEQRLRHALRLRCPQIPADLGLVESLGWLRRSEGRAARNKVLIVIDQFEQWLHTWDESPDSELVLALRQCDGERLQCLLLIRDDFWLATSRLADHIEVDLVPTRNLQMVDLFDKQHARKVLAEYGRAYGRLPDNLGALSKSQVAFLDQATDGLAEGGKLIPVQLATFSEIMKGREWDVRALRDLGGVEAVGERFLEESFSSASAAVQNRAHEVAVQGILKALLPEAGTNIKGAMRSESELRAAAGYESQPRQFEQVCKILDADLRLITPSDPDGRDHLADPAGSAEERYYQLTHDFLVPAIRSWLNHRRQLSLTGRAAMRLADRAEVWTARPQRRHLPSWGEWASFLLFTRPSRRDSNERRMLAAATKKHLVTTVMVLIATAGLSWIAFDIRGRSRAESLAEQLTTATTQDVSGILDELDALSRWNREPIHDLVESQGIETKTGLHLRLAMLRREPDNRVLLSSLAEHMLAADLNTVPMICDELSKSSQMKELGERMWSVAEDETGDSDVRFRAALALATYDPPTSAESTGKWTGTSRFVAEVMIAAAKDPRYYLTIKDALLPARDVLYPHLRRTFSEIVNSEERQVATRFVIDLFEDDPQRLVDGFLDADDIQIPQFLPLLDDRFAEIRPILNTVARSSPNPNLGRQAQEATSNRQVNAAAFLMRHGMTEELWDLLRHDPIPNTRSGLIERSVALGLDPDLVITQAESLTKADVTAEDGILSALLLMLGTYDTDALSSAQQERCRLLARTLYVDHPRTDVHAASDWLLRRRRDDGWIRGTLENLAHRKSSTTKQWSVNSKGDTFVRFDHEGGSIEIGMKEVCMPAFREFLPPGDQRGRAKAPDEESPAILVSWFDAVEYCRWLTAEEGMGEEDMCYPPLSAGAENIHLYEDYQRRRGYRLPTADEWEAACFGQATTRFFFGHRASLLDEYGWIDTIEPDIIPLRGQKKPSPTGLFDLIGGTSEWCSPITHDGTLDRRPIAGPNFTATLEKAIRLTHGGVEAPNARYYTMGMRICRSLPPPDADGAQ